MPRGKSSVANQELLSAALEGLEAQKKRIEEQIKQVQALLGHRRGRPASNDSASSKPVAAAGGRRRKLSAAARKRIAAAQKRRWAEYRKREGEKE
ncbi:MAG: hypothetical protein ACM336_10925 [Acidobacteriota bacterium]